MSNILATGGNSIKLWETTTNYTLCQDIASTNGAITGLTWSQGGQCLASLGSNGDEISLSAVNAKSAISIGVIRAVDNPTCIQFVNRNHRYIGIGNKQGSIVIWDIKTQSQKKAFNVMSSPVSGIKFSHNDSHIAASTSKGSISIVSAVNNITSGPFDIFKNQAVTDLAYNTIKRSLLGISSYSGLVSLFDTYASKPIHSYEAHAAPASSIAFSPINELLMISVGYDKKFNCFNLQTKKPAMSQKSAVPLTSCTFLSGGQQVALGTMTGQVLIHDLRNLRSPLHSLAAHTGKVSCIVLQHLGKTVQSDNLKVSETAAVTRKSKNSVQEPTPKELPTETLPNPTTPVKDKEFDKLTIFSPIRQTESTILHPNEHELGSSNNSKDNKSVPIGGISSDQWWDDPDSPKAPRTALESRTALSHRSPISSIISPVRKIAGGVTAGTMDITGVLSPIRETSSVAGARGTIPATSYGDVLFSPIRATESAVGKTPSISYTSADGDTLFSPIRATESVVGKNPSIIYTPATPSQINLQEQIDIPNKSLETEFEQLLRNKENQKPNNEPQEKINKNIIVEGDKIKSNKIESSKRLTPVTRNKTPISTHSLDRKVSSSVVSTKEQSPLLRSSMVTGGSNITTTPSRSMSRNNPASPRRRQFMRQLQGTDLIDQETPVIPEEIETHTTEQLASLERAEMVPAGGDLQMSLIRSCVRDVVEELEENVNRRFMNLHSHFVKEFIQHQELMKELFKMNSLNDELLQENQRLEEENRHLRANY